MEILSRYRINFSWNILSSSLVSLKFLLIIYQELFILYIIILFYYILISLEFFPFIFQCFMVYYLLTLFFPSTPPHPPMMMAFGTPEDLGSERFCSVLWNK